MRLFAILAALVATVTVGQAQSIVLEGTTVRVRGTSGADDVRVESFDGDVVVYLQNETDFIFDVYQDFEVRRVVCSLGGGDDTFDATTFTKRCVVSAGRGDDTVLGGLGDDVIRGNRGNDYLDGGPGIDRLLGGDDRDIVIGGTGIDGVFGDGGQDIVIGGQFIETEGNIGLAKILWFDRPDDNFEPAVVAFFETGFTFVPDFDLDFVVGGKEADLFVVDADEVITDGVGWPSGNFPTEQGDRVDAVFVELGDFDVE